MKFLNITLFVAIAAFSMSSGFASQIEHYTHPDNKVKGLPFSEAVRVGNTIYLAGQIGVAPGDSKLIPGGLVPETEQTLKNIDTVLKHFSLTFKDIVKCQVMLADIKEWPAFNIVYKKYFSAPYPARSAFASSGLALGARVEVECIAVIPPRA